MQKNQVDSPEHYQFGQLEAWDIIELAIENTPDPVTAYHQASALKYLLRASRKGGDTDIAKACAHLKREVARHIVRVRPSSEYDPHDVAFRHDVIAKLGEAAVSGACEACGHGDITAAELADADGVSEYGNPVTPAGAQPDVPPWRLP